MLKDPSWRSRITKKLLQCLPDIQLIYVFGSVAQEAQTDTSDLDVAIFCGKTIDNIKRWEVSQQLAIELAQDVDLIDLSSCSTVMRFEIIDTGQLLFDAADEAAEFENVSISMYQHLHESRQLIVKDLVERLTNG